MLNQFAEFNTADSSILFPVALRRVGWQRRDGTYEVIPGNRAIVRLNPQGTSAYPLSVVSNTYKLVTNRELLTVIEDALTAYLPSGALDGVQVTDQISHFGKNCYRTYVFPNMRCDIGARSDIAFRVVMKNGYGGSAVQLLSGAIEFWCSNGMVRGQYEQAYHRHTSQLRIQRLEHVVTQSIDQFWKNAEEYKRWVEKPVTREQTMALFQAIAKSPSFFDALSNQWVAEVEQRGRNVWSVYSALTYYASHSDGEFTSRADASRLAFNMVNRELAVAKWIETPQWRQLVEA